ncbi:winged helix-turn-helix domain-containing protein [Nonomuraea sp. NPDC059007]|uniref:AfsR/SARP family transcriptional regulator n=1 Tax=Nonomuraea sp. NPDC059007 TaxID=3346692 RepID=UPI00368A57FD
MNTTPAATSFGLLGALEVTRRGRRVAVPGAKQRIVLASLLLSLNQPVSAEAIIHHVWDDDPPRKARESLHTLVARLRVVLRDDTDDEKLIHTAYRRIPRPGRRRPCGCRPFPHPHPPGQGHD